MEYMHSDNLPMQLHALDNFEWSMEGEQSQQLI